MTYKDLIKTFKIVAKYDGGLDKECLRMQAVHDEHGIEFDSKWELSAKDVRRLAEMGWGLGCDGDFDEDEYEKWSHPESLSDDEIVELFKNHNGIFKFD